MTQIISGTVVENRALAIRKESSILGERIGTVYSGEVLEIVDTKTEGDYEWAAYYIKVWSAIKRKYPFKPYIYFDEDLLLPHDFVVVEDRELAIRKDASVFSGRIGTIYGGEEVTIFDTQNTTGYLWGAHYLKVWSAIKNNVTGKLYIELDAVIPPPQDGDDPKIGHWFPDPNPPENMIYTREGGFAKVPVYDTKWGVGIHHIAVESTIFVGDRIENNFLHLLTENTKDVESDDLWIDLSVNGMIDPSYAPQEVIHSLCPPALDAQQEIVVRVTAPLEDGKTYWYIKLDEDKPYNFPVPNTVPMWEDKTANGMPGFTQVPDKWQWFIFDAIKMSFPGQGIVFYFSAYAYFIRDNGFWTDVHDKDSHRDVVLGRNMNAENYWVKWSLTTRGNVLQAYHKNGADIYLDGFDITQDPPRDIREVFANDAFFHYQTQVYPKVLANGENKVTHSPPSLDGVKHGIKAILIFRTGIPVDKNEIGAVEIQPGDSVPVVNLESMYE